MPQILVANCAAADPAIAMLRMRGVQPTNNLQQIDTKLMYTGTGAAGMHQQQQRYSLLPAPTYTFDTFCQGQEDSICSKNDGQFNFDSNISTEGK